MGHRPDFDYPWATDKLPFTEFVLNRAVRGFEIFGGFIGLIFIGAFIILVMTWDFVFEWQRTDDW